MTENSPGGLVQYGCSLSSPPSAFFSAPAVVVAGNYDTAGRVKRNNRYLVIGTSRQKML